MIMGIIFFSTIIQSCIGFGFALIATPLLLIIGLPLPQIVAITIASSTFHRSIFCFQMRKNIQFSKFKIVVIMILIGVPIGIYILGIVSGGSRDLAKQMIGALLVMTVIIQTTVKNKPKEHVNKLWDCLAGLSSGILGGFANIGGPSLVLWVYSHNWVKEQLRAAPLAISIFMIPLQFFFLFNKFGGTITKGLLTGLISITFVLVANQIGQRLGKKFNMETLRILVIVALGIMGIFYILQPILLA